MQIRTDVTFIKAVQILHAIWKPVLDKREEIQSKLMYESLRRDLIQSLESFTEMSGKTQTML